MTIAWVRVARSQFGEGGHAPMVHKVEHCHRSTTVGGTADGSRWSTGDTLNMGASAGIGEALAWAIASDVPSTPPSHGYTSGAHGEPWSM